MSATTHKKETAFPNGIPNKIIKKPPLTVHHADDVMKNAKVKFTKDGMCRVTAFTRPIYKSVGYEVNESWQRAEVLQHSDNAPPVVIVGSTDRKRVDSLKRAKDKIFEISACNDWDYMVTLTLDKEKVDRYDSKEIVKPMQKWLDNMVQRRGLKALIIPEYHPTDHAIHFHGLINNSLKLVHSGTFKVKGRKKPVMGSTLRKMGKKPTDNDVQDVFNVIDYKLGFSTAVPLDGNVTAVAFYMTKYATKELDKIFGSYYWAVGKIQRELPYVICNMDFEDLAKTGKVFDLPEGLGKVCYATITKDDFEGSEVL